MNNRRREHAVIIFIIFLTTLLCLYLLFDVIDLLKYRNGRPEDIIYTNKNSGDVNYSVYLKPNDFINKPYITDDFSFISSLVEYIATSFSYTYTGNSNVSVNYDYYIKANIISKDAEDNTNITKPLWNKEFILLDHKTGSVNNSKIKINEKLNIGIDYYNNLINNFNNTLNIPLNSRLDVTLVVSVNGEVSNKAISREHQITLSIPLGVKVFDMDITKTLPEKEIIYSKEPKSTETSYMFAIIYIILIIVIVGITYFFIKLIINREKGIYQAKVSKLLREYDDRIVTVSNFIRYEKLEIVNIPSFDELLTFSDETLEPIIYWEKANHQRIESWFSIVRDKILYRYTISYDRHHKE